MKCDDCKKEAKKCDDCGRADADKILLNLIGDDEISRAYDAIPKWYS